MNKRNCIIISPELKKNSGGWLLSKLFFRCIKERYDVISVYFIPSIMNNLQKLILCLKGDVEGIDTNIKKQILDTVLDKKIEFVFINHSFYGNLVEEIKALHPRIVVVTLFHNIESQFVLGSFKSTKNIGSLLRYFAMKRQEKKLASLSDRIIVLNKRDSDYIKQDYKQEPSIIIPIAIEDQYNPEEKECPINNEYALFVGSNFYANIDGLRWFAGKVSHHITYPLVVVGKGMEVYEKEFQKYPNIIIKGFVEDLAPYYYNAKVVVSPIFKGSGMKTKTAEALMYAKSIIGTREAFEGFTIPKEVGIRCDTPSEFINAYNNCSLPKFNHIARNLYLQYYDTNAFEKLLSQVI